MAKRTVTSSPPFTGAWVLSQLVAPASPSESNPVPASSPAPLGQYGLGGLGQPKLQFCAKVPSRLASHTSKNAMLTLTGFVLESNEILPLIAPIGGGETSAMN